MARNTWVGSVLCTMISSDPLHVTSKLALLILPQESHACVFHMKLKTVHSSPLLMILTPFVHYQEALFQMCCYMPYSTALGILFRLIRSHCAYSLSHSTNTAGNTMNPHACLRGPCILIRGDRHKWSSAPHRCGGSVVISWGSALDTRWSR